MINILQLHHGIINVGDLPIPFDMILNAAVLTIVGYSMNDTVVIYDRVRDNLKKYSNIKIFEVL